MAYVIRFRKYLDQPMPAIMLQANLAINKLGMTAIVEAGSGRAPSITLYEVRLLTAKTRPMKNIYGQVIRQRRDRCLSDDDWRQLNATLWRTLQPYGAVSIKSAFGWVARDGVAVAAAMPQAAQLPRHMLPEDLQTLPDAAAHDWLLEHGQLASK